MLKGLCLVRLPGVLSNSDGCACIKNLQCVAQLFLSSDVKLKIESSGPQNITKDWIGPADPESNIRKYKFVKPVNETIAHRQLRELREDTHRFNHQFWAKHNKNFFKLKEKYIQQTLKELRRQNPTDPPEKLSAEQLSQFYKHFLDANYQLHRNYNREWYRRNFRMIWLSLKVKLKGVVTQRNT